MRYKINEIFYTLQGEGFFTGTPSVFIRFSGCNLRCPFCDTEHEDGEMLTLQEVVGRVVCHPAGHVVLTGGEPSLFVTDELMEALHGHGRFIAMETNGTHALPAGVDWVTLSPKDAFLPGAAKPVLTRCDEIKVVYDGRPVPDYSHIEARHRFLQPCDTGNAAQNKSILEGAIRWCLEHPDWRLSLQTHKLMGIR